MIEFSPATVTHEGVHVGYREHFEAKLAKINAKLAKIGAPAATIAFGPIVTKSERDDFGRVRSWNEFATVTVTGVEAKLAGWSAVAALDHTLAADEALVSRFPAHFDTVIPDGFRFRGSVCDHCNINIARNLTVLFVHDDGRWAQVGTTCILEYIGIDPSTVLLLSTWNVRFDEDGDEPRGGRYFIAPVHFLAAAAEATRLHGFTRSGEIGSTRDSASDLAYGRIKPKDIDKEFPGLDYDLGHAKAEAVMAWVAASTDSGDFMTSARLACRSDIVNSKTEGLLAALPFCYDREIAKNVERVAKNGGKVGGFRGEVGKKLIVTGTVTVATTFEGHYGMKRIVVVTDAEGNAIKTSGSGDSLWDAEVGDTIRFQGKVSEHADSKYGKQTVIKMAKVFVLADDGTDLPSLRTWASQSHAYGHNGTDSDTPDTCYHCVKAAHSTAVAA